MLEDTPQLVSDWLTKLSKRLADRQPDLDRFDSYYRGAYSVRLSERFARNADLERMVAESVDNWMGIIVDSSAERLRVEGFRLGDNPSGDKRAWRIWQENNLDADSDLAHTEALVNGEAAALVSPFEMVGGSPLITVEHPSQVIVATAAENRRVRLAALKRWVDDEDGFAYATLYLPDWIYKFRSRNKSSGAFTSANAWERREVNTEPWPLPNPLGVVPVVPLLTRRRMLGPGESEIAQVTANQDRINRLTLDMMVTAYYSAFKQKWASGLEIPKDPETNKPIETLKAAVDHVWTTSNPDAKFGEFSQVDLENYIKAIEMQVQHIAVKTRTPPHYLFLRGNMPSGESLRTAETGLVKKVTKYAKSYGESWEEVMRLALDVAGIRARGAASMETQWADPESRTESEHVDGVMKRVALGVPLSQLWRDLGYSEEQIGRFAQMLADEADYRATLGQLGRLNASSPASNGSEPESVPA